jgi:hypothetical protein
LRAVKWALLVAFAAALAAVGGRHLQTSGEPDPGTGEYSTVATPAGMASGALVRVEGRVVRILADDRDGSPHQRFIIATNSGTTLLIAHNLDLAPRLEGLALGDMVMVAGEYESNPQGGLIHWTHDDPQGRHPAGYIEWRGRRYQ